MNRKISEGRRLCQADINVAMQLIEQHFPTRSCSTNGHSAVCQLIRNMKTKGAPRRELGIERAMSMKINLSLMHTLQRYSMHKRTIVAIYFNILPALLCPFVAVSIIIAPVMTPFQIGKLKKLVRCSIRVVQTMVNDENLLQRLRVLRAHPMYKPEALGELEDDVTSRYIPDDAEDGGMPNNQCRMLGRQVESLLKRVDISIGDVKDMVSDFLHMVNEQKYATTATRVVNDEYLDMKWPQEMCARWTTDVMDSIQCDIGIYGFASLTGERFQDRICSDSYDDGGATMNSCFLFSMPRTKRGPLPLPLTDEDLIRDSFRDFDKEKFDSMNLTMAAQVTTHNQHV